MGEIRINKYIADAGVCSRREADRLIAEGRVSVNGAGAAAGMKVADGDTVTLNGEVVRRIDDSERVVYAYYKPRGLICSYSHSDRSPTIYDELTADTRLFSIGRLDKDSEGLLLLTDRGELVNAVNRSVFHHEKEYIVSVRKPVTDDFILALKKGVSIRLGDRVVRTKPCQAKRLDDYTFDMVLTEGLNRQIRRMCETLGYKVTGLKRVRVMNIKLGDMQPGELRKIEGEELKDFEEQL